MILNYFEDLWEKAKKKGIKKYQIGCELYGRKLYTKIYAQGKVSKYMQKRHEEIDAAIDIITKRK